VEGRRRRLPESEEDTVEIVEKPTAPHIYTALVAVGAELAKTGIAKDRKNEAQGFKFRGIDDVQNAISPIFAKQHIVLTIDYADYPDVDRLTGKGATLIYTKVKGTYHFTSALDGSAVTVTTFGVGMDTGDKGMAKAQTAALKTALLQTFLVPTESTEDADATAPPESIPAPPAGFDEWFPRILAVAEQGTDPLQRAWGKSKKDYRKYVATYHTAKWDAAKALATQVSARTQEPA
jgi:hypothetical protein